ncbi:MAG: hypothetical protein WKH64_08100 [Chloroflexia bacterium]
MYDLADDCFDVVVAVDHHVVELVGGGQLVYRGDLPLLQFLRRLGLARYQVFFQPLDTWWGEEDG